VLLDEVGALWWWRAPQGGQRLPAEGNLFWAWGHPEVYILVPPADRLAPDFTDPK
jgi:heme/copper-type cytochrome/quinol oxidase subunit 1